MLEAGSAVLTDAKPASAIQNGALQTDGVMDEAGVALCPDAGVNRLVFLIEIVLDGERGKVAIRIGDGGEDDQRLSLMVVIADRGPDRDVVGRSASPRSV